jgi:hypothetical protein
MSTVHTAHCTYLQLTPFSSQCPVRVRVRVRAAPVRPHGRRPVPAEL